MKLTIIHRFKLCYEILMTRSNHPHLAEEKQLSVFQRGYHAGLRDRQLENEY